MFTVDLTGLPRAEREQLHAHFTREKALAARRAVRRQETIAAHYARNPPRSINGIGGQTSAIDPVLSKLIRLKHGDDAFDDPDKRKFVLKKYPALRVRHGRTDPTRAGDAISAKGRVVFHKSYG